jgi:hypothetical protein
MLLLATVQESIEGPDGSQGHGKTEDSSAIVPAYRMTSADCHLRIKDINANCLDQFKAHWECLENNNQQMWQCRQKEWSLNKCVFEKLVCHGRGWKARTMRFCWHQLQGLEKRIPDQPKDEVPVQFRRNQIYAHASIPITQFPYLTPGQRAEQVENLRARDPKRAARIDLWDEQQRQKEAAEAAAPQAKSW